jgi:transposase
MAKHPGGAPTKYKPEYCQRLTEFLAQGYPFEAFAGEINVNPDTVYEWCKVHKEFSDAKKMGRSKGLKWFSDMGRAGAAGKIKGFNATPWIFMLKNIYGWKDKLEISEFEEVDEVEWVKTK